MAKYVFFTGGVASGLGKGITAASLGRLLKARGYRVTLLKVDPYFNVDSSNLSPYQHGEIYVTNDGAESDMGIGHYERFIDKDLGSENVITSGKIYSSVIAKERTGDFNGGTVQIVPHITDEIKRSIYALDNSESDIVIAEVGGTVGDIECHPFLEAIRQIQSEVGRTNVAFVHMTLVPYIEMSGEQKTKPTQRSVKELQIVGIQPDVIICRSDYSIDEFSRKKVALFCNVGMDCIIQNLTTNEMYSVPLKLESEGLARVVLRKLRLPVDTEPDLSDWKMFVDKIDKVSKLENCLKIGIVGKYTTKHNAYASLAEALFYSSLEHEVRLETIWLESDEINSSNAAKRLQGFDGIVIPAGFGERGFEGKMATAKFAREKNIPVIMCGLGAQAAIVEFARNVCSLKKANSIEFEPNCPQPVVKRISTHSGFKKGLQKCNLADNSLVQKIYGKPCIYERHRHKYEFNKDYQGILEQNGLVLSGFCDEGSPEIFELTKHRFYVGVIFRPEFTARPTSPNKLISAFIKAVSQKSFT